MNRKEEGDNIRTGSKGGRGKLLCFPAWSSLRLLIMFTGMYCRLCDELLWLNKPMRDSPASSLTLTLCGWKAQKHVCQIGSWLLWNKCRYDDGHVGDDHQRVTLCMCTRAGQMLKAWHWHQIMNSQIVYVWPFLQRNERIEYFLQCITVLPLNLIQTITMH